jgi:Predicted membrane protein
VINDIRNPNDKSITYKAGRIVNNLNLLLKSLCHPSMVSLILRIGLAVPFWKSGVLKWDGFLQLKETAVDLFSYEFMIHLPWGTYPFPEPALFAFLSGCGEILLPVLLVAGLGTRFAALGILFMTLIIEMTIPDGWPVHLTWAAMAFGLMVTGAGKISIDAVLQRLWAIRVGV